MAHTSTPTWAGGAGPEGELNDLKILVTGATGYVGGRLVPLLVERGHVVRTTTSAPDREQPWWADQVETVVMDALDGGQVTAACSGMDAIYYLIHGMGGEDFADTDRQAASNFAEASRTHARSSDRLPLGTGPRCRRGRAVSAHQVQT